jgi:hypothetical protein
LTKSTELRLPGKHTKEKKGFEGNSEFLTWILAKGFSTKGETQTLFGLL